MFPFLKLNRADLFDIFRVLLWIAGPMAWMLVCVNVFDNQAQSMFASFMLGGVIYCWWPR